MPIFAELAPFFREAWEGAPDGQDRIFPDVTPDSNLRTWLGKLATRAGVELWEKPWVNLRASAVTDAADQYPSHVCEAWFGHSEAIANRHYRQVTEDHFQKAIRDGWQKGGEASEKAGQNPAHLPLVGRGKASSKKQQAPVFPEEYEGLLYCTSIPVPPRGVEPIAVKRYSTNYLRRINSAGWRKIRRICRRIRSHFAVGRDANRKLAS